MKPCVFTGNCVALATPMYEDGSINLEGLTALIEFVLSGGVDAILVCGTTGEASTLTPKEREAVIRRAVCVAGGRVPVLVGTGSNDTAHAIEQSQVAQELGADALLLVTPYYNKTSQEGMVRHFTAIADAVHLPVILYNVPSRTGVNIQPATYRRLADHPRIVATKEANGDLSAMTVTRNLCGEDLWIYSGNDDQIVPFFSLGGIGVISVLANIRPALVTSICSLCLSGEIAAAGRLQVQVQPLVSALFSDVNPIPVKYALNRMGFAAGPCRLPLVSPTPVVQERLDALLFQGGEDKT